MITKHIMYGVKCDRCGAQFEDSDTDYTAWADENDAWESASNEDWIEIDGKHYCPCCYTENEETEEFTPRPPYPQSFRDFRHRMRSILPNLEIREDSKRQFMCTMYYSSEYSSIPIVIIEQIASFYGLAMEVEKVKYGRSLIFSMK